MDISELIDKIDIPQKELAAQLGISETQLSNWKKGSNPLKKILPLIEIAAAKGIFASEIFGQKKECDFDKALEAKISSLGFKKLQNE